jgi:hypothetical protein
VSAGVYIDLLDAAGKQPLPFLLHNHPHPKYEAPSQIPSQISLNRTRNNGEHNTNAIPYNEHDKEWRMPSSGM